MKSWYRMGWGVLVTLTGIVFVKFCIDTWQLSLHRYFDIDEFAHISWAYYYHLGKRPYIDFFSFFPPGFHWILQPLFWMQGFGIQWLESARSVVRVFFYATAVGVALLFWQIRRSWMAIVVPLILVFLPMPADKFIEVRPDMVAVFFAVCGMVCLVQWMAQTKTTRTATNENHKKDYQMLWGVCAGMFYAVSCVVVTKMVPFVVVAFGITVLWSIQQKKALWPFIAGGSIVAFGFFVWMVSLGNISTVFYALTKLPIEANRFSQQFGMRPELFFYPNDIYYGCSGWCVGVLMNHILWMIGIIVGLVRLLSPYLPRGKEGIYAELLVAGTFVVEAVLYVNYVPLKHTQYLVPIAIFIAYFVVDGAYALYRSMTKSPGGTAAFFMLYGGVLVMMWYTHSVVVTPKLGWTNTKDLTYMSSYYAKIPKTATVLDLDGRFVGYPNPYPLCCLPKGEFEQYLSHRLPSLIPVLEATKTQFIYQGGLKRVESLAPDEKTYVHGHYEPYNGDELLLVRKQ